LDPSAAATAATAGADGAAGVRGDSDHAAGSSAPPAAPKNHNVKLEI
jgi:hypothetical protein